MRVIFTSPSALNYKGKRFVQGDELEITETFYNQHESRFTKLDDNFVMDAEFTEIKNVKPVEKEVKKPAKKAKKGKNNDHTCNT